MRRCRVCGEEKDLDGFYPSKLRARSYICKECDKAAVRAREKARPSSAARKAKWRARALADREPRPARPGTRPKRDGVYVLPADEYCPVCDCWISPHGIGKHEARHARERVA